MKLFKKLKRNEISKKFYGYHSENKINDRDSANNYLDMIINYLNNYTYKSDNNFVMAGRKKFVYDEVIDILDGKVIVDEPIYFVLGSLEEFMCNDNNTIYQNDVIFGEDFVKLNAKNDKYIKNGCICLEEKEIIVNMINKIKSKI